MERGRGFCLPHPDDSQKNMGEMARSRRARRRCTRYSTSYKASIVSSRYYGIMIMFSRPRP